MEIWLWYVRIVGNWELFHKWNLGLFYVYIGPPGEEGLKILILRLSAQLWQIIPLCLRWGYAHIDKFFSNQLIHSSLGSLLREFINHDKSKRIQLDIVDSYGDTSEPVVTVFTSNSPVILLLKKTTTTPFACTVCACTCHLWMVLKVKCSVWTDFLANAFDSRRQAALSPLEPSLPLRTNAESSGLVPDFPSSPDTC